MLIGNLFKHWTYKLFAPGTVLKEKYTAFKSLLAHDKSAHDLMAELEEIYYHRQKKDYCAVEKLCRDLSKHVAGIVDDLSRVCPARHPDLRLFYKKIDAYIRFILTPDTMATAPPYIRRLKEIDAAEDLPLVGGKALHLGIIRNHLQLPTPDGFVITTNSYRRIIDHNHLRSKIDVLLANIDIDDTASLDAASVKIRNLIMASEIPGDIEAAMAEGMQSIASQDHRDTRVAMRSSAVGEDSRASFAGQYLTVLNVDPESLTDTYKKIIAGKYSAEAISYRISYGFADHDTPMAVLVLNMVDAAASGILYTADIGANRMDRMSIHAIWGLGELLVSGQTPSDLYIMSKDTESKIILKQASIKPFQIVPDGYGKTKTTAVGESKAAKPSLDDNSAVHLARWGIALENHFKRPQDIEWAVDTRGNPYILQSRPLNSGMEMTDGPTCVFDDIQNEILIKGGDRAASGIAAGVVFNLEKQPGLAAVPAGAVLVARHALPQYAKVINRLAAVVTDTGSSAGHFASVAREFNVPALVNTQDASKILEHGRTVTVHADGPAVYDGIVNQMLESPCAKIDLIIDSPFMRNLNYIMTFATRLELVNPDDRSFTPQRCRSFHDIIRFAHEKAVREMFHISDKRLRKPGSAKRLESGVPLNFYILDVGGGLREQAVSRKKITIDDVHNRAVVALWEGLTHPDIHWGEFSHFDWEAHDRIVMSGGIASPKATMFASHAVISDDYMNLNFKFGYHFVIVDALCGPNEADNTILIRFSGGGADLSQRILRANFVSSVLRHLGFDVKLKSDLVDGQFNGADLDSSLLKLDMLGRLLGATRLMDMYLKDAAMIDGFVDDFMQGRYHFESVELNSLDDDPRP